MPFNKNSVLPSDYPLKIKLFRRSKELTQAQFADLILANGHLSNPVFTRETLLLSSLPHQRIAVYQHMLQQSPLRFLLDDDFRLSFQIVSGTDACASNPFLGEESNLVIVSADTLAEEQMFDHLKDRETAAYNLVVFDEAHKLLAMQVRRCVLEFPGVEVFIALPGHAATFLRPSHRPTRPWRQFLLKTYLAILEWFLPRRYPFLVACLALLFYAHVHLPYRMFGTIEVDEVHLNIKTPGHYGLEKTRRLDECLEESVSEVCGGKRTEKHADQSGN